MNLTKQIIIIVSAYESGYYLALAFIGQGYQCFHINTSINASAYYLTETVFSKTFNTEKESLDSIILKLQQYNIRSVVAGDECGVLIADQIAASLLAYVKILMIFQTYLTLISTVAIL